MVVQTVHAWSVLVALHSAAAGLAMVLGPANLIRRPRGDRPHRIIGRIWVGLMYLTALSSFFIQTIRPGSFSWIHVLSALTIATLTMGLWHARRGERVSHAAHMIGTYIGLWGAFIGVVAFPDRLIPQAFQASWPAATAVTTALVLAGLVVIRLIVRSRLVVRP